MIDLKTFPFFSTLPRHEVEKLKSSCHIRKYSSGTKIILEGEEIKDILLVVEGQVSVIKAHGGRKKTLFTLDPGDTYGEVEVLNGTSALTTLIGYQDFQIIFIPKIDVLRLIGLNAGFARELRYQYTRRASILLEQGLSKAPLGQVIMFFNVKGGAGKSVISANTGVMLAKKWRKRVVLLDLNLAFGDQAILLNLPNDRNIYELLTRPGPLRPEKIESQLTRHKSGLKVLLPPPMPELAEKIRIEFIEQIIESLRADYDYIIIDTHNQMSELELRLLEISDLILLIMTMELTFVKNTKLLLELFQRMKIPREKVKVILNRAFKTLGLEPSRVENSLRYAISYFIPSEGDIVIPSINKGTPFVLDTPENSPLVMSVEKLCQCLVGEESDKGTWNMFSMIKDVFGL